MKPCKSHLQRGMALVEIIGVLAIIAILVGLLLPRIRKAIEPGITSGPQAIANARTGDVLIGIRALKSAAAQHRALSAASPDSSAAGAEHYDRTLITAGLLDKPFSPGLGTHSQVRRLSASGLGPTSPVQGANGAFDLRGSGQNAVVGASFVVVATIEGVPLPAAQALNQEIDGPGSFNGDDSKGQVIVRRDSSGTAQVHIYVTHF